MNTVYGIGATNMNEISKKDRENAVKAIEKMIDKSERAQLKFAEGTPQHTLQKNRIKALSVALALIQQELIGESAAEPFSKEEFENAEAPIKSLISKSEKAQARLKIGSWQYTMLENNLKALYMALPLLEDKLQ